MRKIKNKIDSSESLSIFLIKKIKLLKRLFKKFYFFQNEFKRENMYIPSLSGTIPAIFETLE